MTAPAYWKFESCPLRVDVEHIRHLGEELFLKYIADLDLTDYTMESVKVTTFNNNTAMLTYKVIPTQEIRRSSPPANDRLYRFGIPSAWRSLGERFHADDHGEAVIAT